MRRTTILMFQLFLAMFAYYAISHGVANGTIIVPILCLILMFLVGRHPARSYEDQSRFLART
jgi:hypothetical protein